MNGLPLHAGAQLAVDVILRSALTADNKPKPRAADVDGAVAESARRDKELTYPELLASKRCVLVVVALETGGRWSQEASDFVEQLSHAKGRGAQPRVRKAVTLAWQRRWVRLLSTAAAKAFASSLVAPPSSLLSQAVDGKAPALSELLTADRGF